jgi:hypothetical protein
MKRSVFIGVASAAAISTLAFAQTNPAPVPPTNPPAKTMPEGTQTKGTNLRQDLLSSLSQAGFTNVSVKADSFVVQAKDKDGNPVTMLLGPGSFTEVTDVQANGQMPAGTAPTGEMANAGPFTHVPTRDELSSNVVGLSVYNNDNKDIGTIKDVAFDSTGAKAYILAVGGFLGMGDHYVAVRPSAINLSYNGSDKKWHAGMNANADQLKAAPEYKYPSNS